MQKWCWFLSCNIVFCSDRRCWWRSSCDEWWVWISRRMWCRWLTLANMMMSVNKHWICWIWHKSNRHDCTLRHKHLVMQVQMAKLFKLMLKVNWQLLKVSVILFLIMYSVHVYSYKIKLDQYYLSSWCAFTANLSITLLCIVVYSVTCTAHAHQILCTVCSLLPFAHDPVFFVCLTWSQEGCTVTYTALR